MRYKTRDTLTVLSVAPTTLSSQKVPIGKVPVLQVQHRVSSQFRIPLDESEEDSTSPRKILQENPERSVHYQVASSLTWDANLNLNLIRTSESESDAQMSESE
ncbi:hypothetical protein Tco_0996445 [Tanacetum coccineum]